MKRKSGVQVKCDICGKLVFERGLKSHIRLLHKLKLTHITQVTQVATQVKTKVNTKVPDQDRTQVFKEVIEVTRQYKPLHIHCRRCGNLIEVNEDVRRMENILSKIACDRCINEFYGKEDIVEAIKMTTYNKNGISVWDLHISKQLK
jgi:hypothetical protein